MNSNDLISTYGADTSAAQMSPASIVISLIILVVGIIAMWKIFQKAGKPGWHSIIPFLNMYDLMEIAGYNGWMFLLLFIPIANLVMIILSYVGLAKKFGKSTGFAIGLIFLSLIFECILAFGDAKYQGN